MKKTKIAVTLILLTVLVFAACSCRDNGTKPSKTKVPIIVTTSGNTETEASGEPSEKKEEPAKQNKDIVILATSDVHCCPQKGFGYAGLYRIREKFLKEGCEVILVDDGDEIEGHGELFGTVTQGEQVIDLMNKMGYDLAVPGNHDFNYGPDRLIELASKANYPYLSCNITKNGQLVFKPYVIKEVAGKKIAFIGATTPRTMGFYTSTSLFQDENGKTIYNFKNGNKSKKLIETIQVYVDSVREQGVDYVFMVTHIGQAKKYKDYENISYIIRNTHGIDVFLDGHSHDYKKYEFVNTEGKVVPRIGMGSKFSRIGYVRISGKDGSIDVDIFNWTSGPVSAAELFGIKNEMSEATDKALEECNDIFYTKSGNIEYPLMINDAVKKTADGKPYKNISRVETNLGDICADAFRVISGADVAFVPADKFNEALGPGEFSMRDCYMVLPSSKKICVVQATGQQILDALEWSCRSYPNANSGFLQVSGVTLKVNKKQESTIKTKKGKFDKVEGKRRVTDVKIGGTAIDPKKTYKVASYIGLIRDANYGYTMFTSCRKLSTPSGLDFQILYEYLKNNLQGTVGSAYSNPIGQKRITAA